MANGFLRFTACCGLVVCQASIFAVLAFNINQDARHVRTFSGPAGSHFGLTVLGHENDREFSLLVGAPNSTSDCQPDLPGPPGALYKCQATQDGGSCTQVCLDNKGNEHYRFAGRTVEDKKDGQLLGMALTRQPGQNGNVVVCGHRWMNQNDATLYSNQLGAILLYPRGTCYRVNGRLEMHSVEKIRPCITEGRSTWWRCLGGASAEYAVDGQALLLGAPGAMNNQGSVITVDGEEINHIPDIWNWWLIANHQFPSLGYSMSSGHFSSPAAVEGVTGAPRYRDIGAVFVFDVQEQRVVRHLIGEPVNTYFGASVEAVDVNRDMWSDLLVGAPLYSTNQDEGCVYVYINDGTGNLEMRRKLQGSNAIGARFGSAIKTVGDLNKDGFTDIAIGAPYEDAMSGAVYIYHGAGYGVNPKYSQRIPGKSFGLISFGYSLAGSLDLDGNQYPDLIVGAPLNESVVYLKTKPVVYMQATLVLSPATLIMGNASVSRGHPTRSTVIVCLTYRGVNVGSSLDVAYTLEADLQVSSILRSRVYFGSSVSASSINDTNSLEHSVPKCRNHTLTVKNSVKDFLNPIPVQLSYRLHDSGADMAPVLNPSSVSRIRKEIGFGRDCGADNICQADLQIVNYNYSLRSGREEIFLGGEASVFVTVDVANVGEEAHQASLVVTHPENVVYEAVQTITTTEVTIVKCEPVALEDGSSPYIDCSIGNPLKSGGKMLLQLRLDIGNLEPNQINLNMTLSLSTSSGEADLDDNEALVSIPVTIRADVTMNGASTPEQLVYRQVTGALAKHLDAILKTVQRLRDARMSAPSSADQPSVAIVGVVEQDGAPVYNRDPSVGLATPGPDPKVAADDENSGLPVNGTDIGPAFTQLFEIANLGPGRVPYPAVVRISIPWRTREGDWLVFITDVKGRDGVDSCNSEILLERQYDGILRHYNTSSDDYSRRADSETKRDKKMSDAVLRTTFDCTTAECVTLQCRVRPLAARSSAVVEVQARLWKHSLLKSNFGFVSVISNTSVEVANPWGLFKQPDDHLPDETTVKITVSAEEILSQELPLPPWVIPFSTCLGIALLVLVVAFMAKLGFFRRKTVRDMKRQLMQEAARASTEQANLIGPEEEERKETRR